MCLWPLQVTADCSGSSSLAWMRRELALYQVPEAALNKDRIWHRAHDRANDLAGLVLTHCHCPRAITRLSWGQTGEPHGAISGTATPTSFRPLKMVHGCHCPMCDTGFGLLFLAP